SASSWGRRRGSTSTSPAPPRRTRPMGSMPREARARACSPTSASSRTSPRRRRPAMSLEKKLAKAMSRAIADFGMIEDGDRILCAVSGGKDSYALHALLVDLRRRAPVRFDVLALNIDQGHPGYPGHLLTDYMAERGH